MHKRERRDLKVKKYIARFVIIRSLCFDRAESLLFHELLLILTRGTDSASLNFNSASAWNAKKERRDRLNARVINAEQVFLL